MDFLSRLKYISVYNFCYEEKLLIKLEIVGKIPFSTHNGLWVIHPKSFQFIFRLNLEISKRILVWKLIINHFYINKVIIAKNTKFYFLIQNKMSTT